MPDPVLDRMADRMPDPVPAMAPAPRIDQFSQQRM